MIYLRAYIAFTIDRKNVSRLIKGQFNYPYNEILGRCFRNDSESSIGSIQKIDITLAKIESVLLGDQEKHLIIGYNQDPVIECYKDKCKIVDHGPSEIHSVPPDEIYGPNWNKRYPDKEWIETKELIELLFAWRKILIDYLESVCVPYSVVKEEYWKGIDRPHFLD